MSDETMQHDGLGAETAGHAESQTGYAPTAADTDAAAGERVAFCQDCGRPLTRATVRTVPSGPNAGVFCDPCLSNRMTAPYGAPATPYGTTVPPYGAPAAGPVTGVSHPVLAALLGFIPGVGAMYNGQYAKGFVHLIVFAVLVSLKDGINDIFGLLVAGWIFYMVFDAYQTARAYRDGLPLPNPFHLNEVGERFGFGKNPAPYWRATTSPTHDTAQSSPYAPPAAANQAGAPSSSWTGYVPPGAPGAVPPNSPTQGWASTAVPPGYTGYTQSGTAQAGTAQASTAWSTQQPVSAIPPAGFAERPTPPSRIPGAAMWLIGLGVVILLANLLPSFHIDGQWVLPVILATLSVFIFTRSYRRHVRLVCSLRWPVILMVLALLFALQAANTADLGRTWPVIIITVGVLLLLERALGNAPAVVQDSTVSSPLGTSPESSFVPRATWSDPASTELAPTHHDIPFDDTTKGGL